MKRFALLFSITLLAMSAKAQDNCQTYCSNPNDGRCSDAGTVVTKAMLPYAEMLNAVPDSGIHLKFTSPCHRQSTVNNSNLINTGENCTIVTNPPALQIETSLSGTYRGKISNGITPNGLGVKKIVLNPTLPIFRVIEESTGKVNKSFGTAITSISNNEKGLIVGTNEPNSCIFVPWDYINTP